MNTWKQAVDNFRPLGFTQRTIYALWQSGVCTREQLSAYTIDQLRNLHGIGPKGLYRLQDYLSSSQQVSNRLTPNRASAMVSA